jgi:beta-glucosidase
MEKRFLWGTATAAHQIEGGNRNNDWWEWEQLGHIKGGDSSEIACDSWNRWQQDLDLAQELSTNAYRFSLEWSRIEPEEGRFDQKAIDHYREMLQEMRRREIEPILTLHHFTIPLWLAHKGGYEHPDFPAYFERFCQKVVPLYAPFVRYWITINEPNVIAALGYLYGIFPPGVKSVSRCGRVLKQFLLAHARAYRVIKSAAPGSLVSVAINVQNISPASGSPLDRLAADLVDQFYNWGFLKAMVDGRTRMPFGWGSRIPGLANTLDYVGLNYYSRIFIGFRWRGGFAEVRKAVPRSDMDQEIYPQGFYQAIRQVAAFGKPILITESGIADARDQYRPDYLRQVIGGMRLAMREGIPILGYLHWSLMDNFEWNEGYSQKFGLYEMDFTTLERKPRPSAQLFRAICSGER